MIWEMTQGHCAIFAAQRAGPAGQKLSGRAV
jgi:hypothetical protein